MDHFFWGEFFFSQPPRHTDQEKPWGTRSRGGGAYDPPVDPPLLSLRKILVYHTKSYEFSGENFLAFPMQHVRILHFWHLRTFDEKSYLTEVFKFLAKPIF